MRWLGPLRVVCWCRGEPLNVIILPLQLSAVCCLPLGLSTSCSGTFWQLPVFRATFLDSFLRLFTKLHKLRPQLRGSFLIWFRFLSAYMIYFVYIYHIRLFHENIWTRNWQAPNINGFIVQLVRASHQYREVTGSNPVEVLNFLQASYAIT